MSGKVWAQGETLKRFSIAISATASDSEKEAAAELRDYWQAVFGVEPELTDAPPTGPAIWVGFEGAPAEALDGVDPTAFEPQELIIRTFEKDGQPQLLLAGGPEEGTLYAVYQLLEDYLGVRWLTAWDTHIPAAPDSIPAIDFRYTPPFFYRYTHYFHGANAHKDVCPEAPEKVAAFTRHHRGRRAPGGSHTFYRYVPPEKYAKDHPEYYSEVNGKRIAPDHNRYGVRDMDANTNFFKEFGQLCMTNRDVLDIIQQQIDKDIAEDPELRVHHISQMDWYNWCECKHCAAHDEREGTHMGSVLWGLNEIADWLAEKHPDHKLETLAYMHTQTAPKHMKPRPNIIIKLCSIGCDWSTPLFSERNKAYSDDVTNWGAISTDVITWDYYTNYNNYSIPSPNFHVIAPNLRWLRDCGVTGLYEGGPNDEAAEFAALRGYMLGKLMWNPDLDPEAIMTEFLGLYYGPAGEHVRRYIDVLTKAQQASGRSMGCFDKGAWYTLEVIEQGRAIMADAYAAAPSDAVRKRLDRVNATVEYNALRCPPTVEVTGGKVTVSRPDSVTLEEYIALLERIGAKYTSIYHGLDFVRHQVGGSTPPRHQESPLLTLENDRYLLWVAPRLQGTVLRFYDKELDAELLADPAVFGQRGGFWQDWTNTPGSHEHPVAQEYEVAEHTAERVVLETTSDEGLVVRRTMALAPGSDTLDVSLTLTNPTGAPLPPNAKIHPEFFLPAGQSVELQGLKDGAWQPLNKGNEGRSRTIYFDPEYTQLAYFLPKEDRTVFVEVGQDVGGLLIYYAANPEAQHMNLDLRPPQRDLAPGESITFGGKYGSAQGPLHEAKTENR